MGRPPKNPEDAFTYDLRAKVNKTLHDELEKEAELRSADKSQIMREALVEYLEKRGKLKPKKK